MKTRKTAINFFYAQYVTQLMTIDEDANGLFVTVPSESNGESYTVRCTEHHDHVEVTGCTCKGHQYYGYCKHQTIIQNWYNKLYAKNIQQSQEKQVRQAIAEAEEML